MSQPSLESHANVTAALQPSGVNELGNPNSPARLSERPVVPRETQVPHHALDGAGGARRLGTVPRVVVADAAAKMMVSRTGNCPNCSSRSKILSPSVRKFIRQFDRAIPTHRMASACACNCDTAKTRMTIAPRNILAPVTRKSFDRYTDPGIFRGGDSESFYQFGAELAEDVLGRRSWGGRCCENHADKFSAVRKISYLPTRNRRSSVAPKPKRKEPAPD